MIMPMSQLHLHKSLNSFMIQCSECYARCDWSLPMIFREQRHRWRHRQNLFLSFPLWHAVLEIFAGIFLDEQVRASKKVQQEFFKSKKRGGTKKCGKNIRGSWVTVVSLTTLWRHLWLTLIRLLFSFRCQECQKCMENMRPEKCKFISQKLTLQLINGGEINVYKN